jgi:hypothetical protein
MPSVPRDRDTLRYLEGRKKVGPGAHAEQLDRMEVLLDRIRDELARLAELLNPSGGNAA